MKVFKEFLSSLMENAGKQEREHGLCKSPRASETLGELRRE